MLWWRAGVWSLEPRGPCARSRARGAEGSPRSVSDTHGPAGGRVTAQASRRLPASQLTALGGARGWRRRARPGPARPRERCSLPMEGPFGTRCFLCTVACRSNLLPPRQTSELRDSRYQEQRDKLGTLGVEKILIKIEPAPCVDSATLLIVILTVMQVEMNRLSRRRFVFLRGWRGRRCLSGVPRGRRPPALRARS